jgi:hypothetical protein
MTVRAMKDQLQAILTQAIHDDSQRGLLEFAAVCLGAGAAATQCAGVPEHLALNVVQKAYAEPITPREPSLH